MKMTSSKISPPPKKSSKFKIKISAFALAIILTTAAVLITSTCVTTIATYFSEDAATKMAYRISRIMMEKTTFRIRGVLERANGVASSAQAGICIQESAPMPFEDRAGATWFRKWRMWGVMFERSLHGQVHSIAFYFEDGSYVTIGSINYSIDNKTQPLLLTSSRLGTNAPRPPLDQPLPWTTAAVTLYNHSTMKAVKTMTTPVQVEATRRVGYNSSMLPFTSTFSTALSIVPSAIVPTIKISYSMYNGSETFLGVGEVMVSLKVFESLVSAQKPTPNSEVFILDRQRNVVASSITSTPLGSNITVPYNYKLSEDEVRNGCSLATSNMLNSTSNKQFLLCLKNAQNLGYTPLRVLEQMGLVPTKSCKNIYHDVTRERLGDLGNYYISIVDYNADFPGLDWIGIVLIPEDEILNDIKQGRNLAIIACCGLALFIAIGNGFLMRLFLRPLSEIVSQMRSASYLKEEGGWGTSSPESVLPLGDEHHEEFENYKELEEARIHSMMKGRSTKKQEKRSKKAADTNEQLNINRKPSYLTDVASIQTAYWGMVDELGRLRGYIPEHIRDQLIETHQSATTSGQISEDSSCRNGKEMDVDCTLHRSELPFTALHLQHRLSHSERDSNDGAHVTEVIAAPDVAFSVQEVPPFANLDELLISSSTVPIDTSGSNNSNKKSPLSNRYPNGASHSREHTMIDTEHGKNISESQLPLGNKFFEDNNMNTAHDLISQGDTLVSAPEAAVTLNSIVNTDPLHSLFPVEIVAPKSEKASTGHAARFASLGNPTENNDPKNLLRTSAPIPLFAENGLVERNITVAVINITGFHQYIYNTPTAKIIKEHEHFVSYIHEVAKRCGGVLDNFIGDKFWVSFNASKSCDQIYVAATLFAHEVATTVNGASVAYQYYLKCSQLHSENLPPLSPQHPRFPIATRGVTIGVATGRAFVGPLGTKTIRRHTIISNAMSEAAALERMAVRYPDCGVIVGGDMIPAIEGYFQFMLLDATLLPSCGGLRRRIASIKGVMSSVNLKRGLFIGSKPLTTLTKNLPAKNPFDAINACFNAFLEGRVLDMENMMTEITNHVVHSRQISNERGPNNNSPLSLSDGRLVLTIIECHNISVMLQFMNSVGRNVDGRQYRSNLGDLFERNNGMQ